jgi:cytochrome c2
MNTKHLRSITVAILLSGAGTLFAAKQIDTVKFKTTVDSVKTGNDLYENKCKRCHKLKDPAKYTMVQWPRLVNKMQKRAKITDQEKAIILTYLATKARK